ncbi:AAA family ATPase [Leifsonia sp. NPDC058194]|uniref:AAA family ATPase n=1 Tax=Leifsonia sp. NPDC058194 TaxID=3346374 RepID=UPI0036D89B33
MPDIDEAKMQVRRLRVSNYKSLDDDVVVEFDDLTLLVGLNGSGKSNVLDVFRFLGEALTYGLDPAISKRLGINKLRRAAPFKPRAIKIGVDLEALPWSASYDIQINAAAGGTYRVERELLVLGSGADRRTILEVNSGRVRIAPDGLAPKGAVAELTLPSLAADPSIAPVIEALRGVRVHSIYPRELGIPQPIGAAPPLNENGSNWCAVLKTLDDGAKSDLVIALERITGDIRDVRVDSSGGFYTAEFEHELDSGTRRWFSAAQESDGTLRLAGILTALLQSPPPPLLAIEEPELTINPGLLPLLHDYLRATSLECQVVVTTHSPDLLDLVDTSEVRAVQRIGGATQVGRVAEFQVSAVRDSLMSLGGLLRTGGVRLDGLEANLFDDVLEEMGDA